MAKKGTIQINNKDRYLGDGCEQLSLGVMRTGDNQVRVMAWQPGEQSCQLCLYKDGKTVQKISMPSMSVMGMEDIFSVTLTGDNLIGELQGMEYDFQVSGKHRMDRMQGWFAAGKDLAGNTGGSAEDLCLMTLTGPERNG